MPPWRHVLPQRGRAGSRPGGERPEASRVHAEHVDEDAVDLDPAGVDRDGRDHAADVPQPAHQAGGQRRLSDQEHVGLEQM